MVKHPFESVQLKAYLSSIDQNFDGENIKDSLILACNDVRQILPAALYDKLIASITTPPVDPVTDPPSDPPTTNLADASKDAVELLRFAMAPLAFYRAFIWLQLRVSNNSITTYKSTDETTAFGYQVAEAKENLLLRYAAFMRELIDFLNSKEDLFTDWKDSDQRKELNELLIKDYRDFDNYFLTDGDAAFFYRARVIMKEAQDEDIVPMVGKISVLLKPAAPAELDANKIRQVKKALAYLTVSRALFDWDEFYLPATLRRMLSQDSGKTSGNNNGSRSGKTEPPVSDKERLSAKYRNKAISILQSIDVQQEADKAEKDYPDEAISIKSVAIDKSDKHYFM